MTKHRPSILYYITIPAIVSQQLSHWRHRTPENKDRAAHLPETFDQDNQSNGPILVRLVTELLLDRSSQQATSERSSIATGATLGSYKARLQQVRTLNDILWKNSAALNTAEFDQAANDLQTQRCLLDHFLAACDRVEADPYLRRWLEGDQLRPGSSIRSTITSEYSEPLEDLRSASKALTPTSNSLDRGKVWALLGYLQAFVFGNVGYIDPVHKVELKLRYVEEDIADCENMIYTAMLYSRIMGLADEGALHPRLEAVKRSHKGLLTERSSLRSLKAVRPAHAEFIAMSREFKNFRSALGSYGTIGKHVEHLIKTVTKLEVEVSRFDFNY